MKKPEIIKPGKDPKCVHYEIIVAQVGTCKRCGQVRDYSRCGDDTMTKKKARKGQAVLKERRKAGAYA